MKTTYLGAALAALFGACGGSPQGGADAGAPSDAGPGGDAAPQGPLGGAAGAWQYTYTPSGAGEPSMTCTAVIMPGAFDVRCPRDGYPKQVSGACTQLRADVHLSGVVSDGLSGQLDDLVEFSGDDCASHGYTTGAPYPTSPSAVLDAQHDVRVPLPAIFAALGGQWSWTLAEAQGGQAALQSCHVDLGWAAGVHVVVTCDLGEPVNVATECQEQAAAKLDVLVTGALETGAVADSLDGTLTPVLRHTGTGCGLEYPPEVLGSPDTMHAERAATP
jgi:hypothetical protein